VTPPGLTDTVLRPDWPSPAGAVCSTRDGGVSPAPWASMNLGAAVGDDPLNVAVNRARFAGLLDGARPAWLRQVHGTRVLRLRAADLDAPLPDADASWTDEPGIACTVQVADCLPVLLATRDGRGVAAAHAGWRGLAAGVLEHTMAALCDGTGASPEDLVAWLGPCIGPSAFEVGADVREAFEADAEHLVYSPRPDGAARWRADLPALARARLMRAGVGHLSGGGWCTVSEGSRFFSYRRDGVTGRFAAAVWRRA
jgi:polyphenol oxidase